MENSKITHLYLNNYKHKLNDIYIYMGLRQNSGMDRPPVIQTYGSLWITCVLVWMGGMDRPVGSGYGSGLYILTCSHIYIYIYDLYQKQSDVNNRYVSHKRIANSLRIHSDHPIFPPPSVLIYRPMVIPGHGDLLWDNKNQDIVRHGNYGYTAYSHST